MVKRLRKWDASGETIASNGPCVTQTDSQLTWIQTARSSKQHPFACKYTFELLFAMDRRVGANHDHCSKTRHAKVNRGAKVHQRLREDILRMDLRPGSVIDEVSLSNRFSLSRSPIREALVKLAGEGLVEILPNRSTIVSPINFQDIPQFLDTLDLLQRATHRLAAQFRSEAQLIAMYEARTAFLDGARVSIESGNSIPHIERNYDFHMSIAQASGNPYLIRFYGRILDEAKRLGHLRFKYKLLDEKLKPEDLDFQHLQMVTAIEKRDADGVEALAHAHADLFRGQFLEYIMANKTENIGV